MSLVLSRIQLNPFSPKGNTIISDPTRLHDAIYVLFKDLPSGRILFRVDATEGGPTVLIQAECEPNWEHLVFSARDLRAAPQSKAYDPMFSVGEEMTFRLLARATRVESKGKDVPRGPRRDLRSDEERIEWLRRKAEMGGFRVTMCGLTNIAMSAVKSPVPYRAKGGSFAAVQFDGELTVIDPQKLKSTIAQGVGTQKAFGFGLLSIGKIS